MTTQMHFEALFKLVKNRERELFREQFSKLHERDQAIFFAELYPENKQKIADLLMPEEFAELFVYLDFDSMREFTLTLPNYFLEESLNYVPDDVLVEFLSQLELDEQEVIFSYLNPELRTVVRRLLAHEFGSAAYIMTTKFISVSVLDTVDEAIRSIRELERGSETIYYLYCVDAQKILKGVVSLRDLIMSTGTTRIEDVMNNHPVSVHAHMDQEEVAKLISEYDLLAIPVVGDNGYLLGIITVDDIMDIMEDEVTEDFHKFSGIVTEDDEQEVGILGMTKQRLPWIIILIFLGLISANLIGHFEETLTSVVALAAFMPIVLDSAGNVGTQALAVAVRRITLGEDDYIGFFKTLRNEFFTGTLIGIASGITIGLLSGFMYSNIALGMIIGLALFLTLSISTVIGFTVPSLFSKIGIDPAVASGPFITTLSDTFALITYFGLATFFLHLL